MLNRRKKELIGALRTGAGKLILKHLIEDYLSDTCKSKCPYTTYYLLGRKEFIEGLVHLSKLTEDELAPIRTTHDYED